MAVRDRGVALPGAADLTAALRGIRAIYQPIVDLETGAVVAYESLARGPEGTPLGRPDRLFARARETGRTGELDWTCRVAAVGGAHAAGLELPLFVNVEPAALRMDCPAPLRAQWAHATELDLTIEVTERALTADPAGLLHRVDAARSRGWRIAVDDVGADVRSLALMPLLRPDVIKLDLRLVQANPTTEIAGIVSAVNAEHERSGATILAEGIETEAHRRTALAMGATLGQGWLFGRPGPLPPPAPAAIPRRHSRAVPAPPAGSPYAVVREVRATRPADKRLLLSMSLQLEQEAASLGETAVVLSAFQDASRFTPATAVRYRRLARGAAFVAGLGVGMDREPADGVRGATIGPDDPLRGEWSVVVLGPHFAAALVAMDLGDDGDDMARRFDYAVTYDRDLVVRAAEALMRRIDPA